MTSYHFIRNHRSSAAQKLEQHPSELRPSLPQFADKQAFRDWCASESTDHVFYSLVEGVNPHARVTAWNGSNPPYRLHGMVGDYDGSIDRNAVKAQVKVYQNASPKPTWYSRTFSGGLRAVWEFDRPLLIDNEKLGRAIIERLRVRLRMSKVAHPAGAELDPKSLDPTTTWELGSEWERDGDPVAEEITSACLFEAAKESGIDHHREGPEIPLEVVAAEVEKRWPGRWQGQFVTGARGPLFWIDDGIDRTGCQVGDYGMICYSSRAASSFINWTQLLGADFTRQYQERKVNGVLDDIYYDGKKFWMTVNGAWLDEDEKFMATELRVRGLSARQPKGQAISEVEKALHTIKTVNRVQAARNLVFHKRQIVTYKGQRLLNTSTIKALDPVPCDNVEQRCPWLWEFIHNFFDPVPVNGHGPHEYFLAWWKRAWESALRNENGMAQGHGLIIAGGVHTGKTFLSHQILGQSLGGSVTNASEFVNGGRFNKELSERAIAAVDDNTGSVDWISHRRMTEQIKQMVANPFMVSQAKYQDQVTIPWTGRVVYTTNLDAESFRSIPDGEGSVLDKLMYFLCNRNGWKPVFSESRAENEAIIAAEMPFFLGWLDSWEVPEALIERGGSRFGVKAYHHPELLAEVRGAGQGERFAELLDEWAKRYASEHPGETEWRGTATALQTSLGSYPELRLSASQYNIQRIGTLLATMLESKENDLVTKSTFSRGRRSYSVNLARGVDR